MSIVVGGAALTEEQEKKVWERICSSMTAGDRDPEEVIREDYEGNKSHYLRDMAKYFGLFCNSCTSAISKRPEPFKRRSPSVRAAPQDPEADFHRRDESFLAMWERGDIPLTGK